MASRVRNGDMDAAGGMTVNFPALRLEPHPVRQEYLPGCPCHELASRYGLSVRTVFRWTFEKSQGGRPRKLGRALGIDEYARRRAIATIRSSWTWTKVDQSPRLQAGEWRTWWHSSQAAHKPNLRESRWWSWICPSHCMRRSTRSLAIRLR